jgi:hypothetical protein
MSNRKEIFHVLGKAQIVDDKKRFVAYSPAYLNQKIAGLPLNTELELSFSIAKQTRSKSQLAYHWVLMNLISEHTGYTESEIHDWVLRAKFGTKKMKLGALTIEVRRSMSDIGGMTKLEVIDLIEFDIRLCAELEINIPSPESLGYMVGKDGKVIK